MKVGEAQLKRSVKGCLAVLDAFMVRIGTALEEGYTIRLVPNRSVQYTSSYNINLLFTTYFQKAMLPPPRQNFRPAPPDSPSTSLVGLEKAIPPGQSLPRHSTRSYNFDKPLPKLPRESSSTDIHRSNRVGHLISQQREQRTSREMSQREREEYAEWWNQQNGKYSDTATSSQAAAREEKSSYISLRGFLSDPSEADLYMGSTPTKANPYVQEKKRTATSSEPKDFTDPQTVETNGLGRWRRNQATGSGYLISSRMSQRSLVPAPLNLSQEQMTPVETMSRFSSSDSEVDSPQSLSIRESVRSYMRKISLRKSSGKKKGKQPAKPLSSVESVDFPEGCIPPHYTSVYDIRPTASRSSIQRGVADLEKRMRERSLSCNSDMSGCRECYDRIGGEYEYGYGNQREGGGQGSQYCRSSGSRRRRVQQLAVPTSPYQKYGPKIWDPTGVEKIRKKEQTKKKRSKGWCEGEGLRGGREAIKSKIMGHAFRNQSRKNSSTALPIPQEGGRRRSAAPRSPSSQQFSHYDRGRHQIQPQDQNGRRSRSQLTDRSECVEALYSGADQVTTFYELAKKRLGLDRKGERRRKDLKRSIVVLKPTDCSTKRGRSDQWV